MTARAKQPIEEVTDYRVDSRGNQSWLARREHTLEYVWEPVQSFCGAPELAWQRFDKSKSIQVDMGRFPRL